MLRRLGIRWKILAILAVPIAVLTAGALLISLTAVSDSRTTRQVSNLINAAEDMRSVVESLQYERYASVRLLQAPPKSSTIPAITNELEQSRWLTDESLEALREHIDLIDFELLDDRIWDLIENTIEIHARLNVLRTRVDSDSITESAALTSYNDIIRNDVMLASRLGGLIDQRDPAQFLSAYSTLDLLIEYLQQERNLGEVVLNTGARGERTAQDMQTLVALQESLQEDADAELAALDTEARIPSIVSNLPSMRLLVQTGSPDALQRMDVQAWLDSVDQVVANIDPARVEVIEVAAERADEAATDARNQAIITIGGASVAVIVSLVLALLVARGIVIPLRRLTNAAEKVRDDLPRLVEQVATPGVAPDTELERIPVESHDEIGKLASAFNSVNETTVVVAREQAALRGSIAEMFVNVARRDQVLLNRQLSFITQLERTEEDPAQLEDLFRLDHLATRMRRNAESLLVLAGIDSGRRLRNPMAVSDVVRTASSEIEHYDRIDLVLTADPAVLGHAALTVAHLLAELMENATVFSDPNSRVEVMTAMREDGVTISITDDGLGMDAAAVADANEKIRSSSASDVIGAQRLGMFVVGRLAARHDIAVQISSAGEGQGTRVDVLVPLALLDPQSVEQQAHLAGQLNAGTSAGIPQNSVDFAQTSHVGQPGSGGSVQLPGVGVSGGYQPVAEPQGGPEGLPARGAAPAGGLPTRGGQSQAGLPERQPASPGLPMRGAPAAAAQSVSPVGDTPEPVDASQRAGLFTGFRSVAANPLESLESVDASAIESAQQAAYVPLVTEDHDAELTGLSREVRPVEESTEVEPESTPEPEPTAEAAVTGATYEPEISFDSQPLVGRRDADPEPEASAPAATDVAAISYDNAPGNADDSSSAGSQVAAGSDLEQKPQTQIRVYTGAFPTATGEYPTYTGEIPLHTGEMPSYPSRRSRRDTRPEDAQPVVSVDYHVEFEPIGLEDDGPQDAEQHLDVPVESPVEAHQEADPEPAPVQSQFPGQLQNDYQPTTGGFPTVATPGLDVVTPQPAGSFNESVLGGGEAEPEKPKRKRFGFFGRKQEEPESQTPPVRESRFPAGLAFTPEPQQPITPEAQQPAAHPVQPSAPVQPVEPVQPAEPAIQSDESVAWSPQAEFTPELPQRNKQEPAEAKREEQGAAAASFEPSEVPAQPKPASNSTWSPDGGSAQPAFTPQTSWAPTSGGGHGALGAEAAEELRRRSAMTSEVLSELSQLSAYQPEAQQQQPAASLTKRVPSQVPKQVEEEPPAQPARRRDASQVRSMLSGFQAGVNRAATAGSAESVQDGEER